MAAKGLLAYAQIRDGSVTKELLGAPVIATLDKVDVNEAAIAALVASKGQPNGLASLNTEGVLPAAQTGSIALHGYAGEVNSEAAMLALTTNLDGSAIEKGDRVDRLDEGRTYIFSGGAINDAANWRKILAENAAVTTVRNASGTSSETGVVTLADIAFDPDIANLTGAAPVASSGAAGDVTIADTAEKFVATDVEGALLEVMQAVETSSADATTKASTAQSNAITQATQVSVVAAAGADDSHKVFTGIDTGKLYKVIRNGMDVLQAQLCSVDTVTGVITFSDPVLSDEPVTVEGYPA